MSEFEEIDWPEKSWRNIPTEPDPAMVEAVIHTSVTGRSIALPVRLVTGQGSSDSGRGPLAGEVYRRGYNIRVRRRDAEVYAVRCERAVLTCDRCHHRVDVVRWISRGGKRLRHRERCVNTSCTGLMQPPPREKDDE